MTETGTIVPFGEPIRDTVLITKLIIPIFQWVNCPKKEKWVRIEAKTVGLSPAQKSTAGHLLSLGDCSLGQAGVTSRKLSDKQLLL